MQLLSRLMEHCWPARPAHPHRVATSAITGGGRSMRSPTATTRGPRGAVSNGRISECSAADDDHRERPSPRAGDRRTFAMQANCEGAVHHHASAKGRCRRPLDHWARIGRRCLLRHRGGGARAPARTWLSPSPRNFGDIFAATSQAHGGADRRLRISTNSQRHSGARALRPASTSARRSRTTSLSMDFRCRRISSASVRGVRA